MSWAKQYLTSYREIPLFLLGGAFFPQGNTYLHVFEMKYRTMMFDLSQSDDIFGYIHSDGGQIASIGTLCKITQRQLLDDGRYEFS
jgi:Lon protease-like protein